MPVVFDASYIIRASNRDIGNTIRRFKNEIFYITPDLDLDVLKSRDEDKYKYLINKSREIPLRVLIAENIFSREEIESIKRKFERHGLKVDIIRTGYNPEVEIRGKRVGVDPEKVKEVYKFYEDMKRRIGAIKYEDMLKEATEIGVKTDIMLNCLDPKYYFVVSLDDDITGSEPSIKFVNYARRYRELRRKGWTDLAFLIGIIALPIIMGIIKERIKRV